MNTVGKFDTPVQYVKGVGEKRAQLLSKLEIENLYDLTHFYPRTYLDFSSPVPICDVIPGETVCVRATVACPVSRDVLRGRMTVFKTVVTDGSGTLHITIFNNEYSASALKTEEEFLFLGKAVSGYQGLEMTNPIIERPSADFQLRPVYPQTAGLKSKTIEGIMKNALAMISRDDSPDVIPDGIRRRLHLCHERYALSNIHFPSCARDAEIAKRRLIFEELFVLQAGMLKIKKQQQKHRDKASARLHRRVSRLASV